MTSSIYCLVVTVDNFHICHDPWSNKWPIPIPATPLPLSRHALGEICMSVCFISPAVKMLSPFILKCFGFFLKRQFVCSRLVWYLVFDELHPDFFLKLVLHLWICGDHASKCLLCAFYYVRFWNEDGNTYTLDPIISQTIIRSDSDFSFSETS